MFRRFAAVVGLGILTSCTQAAKPSPDAVVTTTTLVGATTTVVDQPTPSELKKTCPDPVVIQLNRNIDVWALPFVGVTAVDGRTGAFAYRAAMLDPVSVLPLGIDIEIRTAATINNGSVLDAMKRDPSILLGAISTTELLGADPSTQAVFAPWDRGDLALAWPSSLGRTAAELPRGSSVPAPPGGVDPLAGTYINKSGLFAKTSSAASTTLAPLDNAATTTTAAPVTLQWLQFLFDPDSASNPAVQWQLVDELGWEPYPFVMVATDQTRTKNEACLRGLVPLLQGGAVRVAREPERLAGNLATISFKMAAPVDSGVASRAANMAAKLNIVGNGNDSTLGDVAAARLAQFERALAVAKGEDLKDFANVERAMRAHIDGRFLDPLIGRGP